MYRAKGSFFDAVVGGIVMWAVVTAALFPLTPASWAAGIVFGLTFYGHIRENG